jgi:hypothetical protein
MLTRDQPLQGKSAHELPRLWHSTEERGSHGAHRWEKSTKLLMSSYKPDVSWGRVLAELRSKKQRASVLTLLFSMSLYQEPTRKTRDRAGAQSVPCWWAEGHQELQEDRHRALTIHLHMHAPYLDSHCQMLTSNHKILKSPREKRNNYCVGHFSLQ